ncbi:uncharacterized protein LOC122050444 [Zingiber officinale]|uniref:uncharacterized protein LOC122050444 n=1 Tax=Zingiber officinale TaxID=94328 RepID=UPI001C4CD0FD|nr:uncharacterized protein LOC122050444 [Zingiber officinale]
MTSPAEGNTALHRRDQEAYNSSFNKDRSTRFRLLSSMQDDLIGEFEKCNTTKDIWDNLKIAFRGTSTTRLRAPISKFETLRKDPHQNMTKHLRMMSSMIHDLKSVSHDLTDVQQVQAVIRSLPDSWTDMKQILTHNESIKNFSDISRHVELEAKCEEAMRATALVAQGGRQQGKKGPKKNFKRKRQNVASTSKEGQTPKRQRGKRGGKRDKSKAKCYNCGQLGAFCS